MNRADCFKCNRNGNGYRIKNGAMTTFEKQILFLRSGSNYYDADEKTKSPKAKASRASKAESSSSSASRLKRKAGKNANEIESSVKRNKNQSSGANDTSKKFPSISSNDLSFPSFFLQPVNTQTKLLQIIFGNLNANDLKLCRQVNSLWSLEATKTLLKKDCFKAIEISNDTVTIHDTADYKLLITEHPLQSFQNILTNSKLFPSTSFALKDYKVGNNVVNFFRENGHLVKSFCFEPDHNAGIGIGEDVAGTGDILLLVVTCFPHLIKLKFVQAFEDPTPALTLLAIENCPDLINLHTLEITSYFPSDVISLILKKAINLKNIYLHPQDNLDYIFSMEKFVKLDDVIPRLKNIHLLFAENGFKVYQELVKHNPKISSIGAIAMDIFGSLSPADVGPVLTKMLHQYSDSLTEILGVKSLEIFPGLNFPVLPNVKRLEIELDCIPLGLNLAEIFPSLKTFEMENSSGFEIEENLLDSLSPLLSVRHLQVQWGERHIPEIFVKQLCSLVPNVTSARFCNPIWDSAYEYVWKLSKLQDLHLEIATNYKQKPKFFVLDSAFTGLSVVKVKNLYEKDEEDLNLSIEEILSFRIKPCISDLKELRKLSLGVFDTSVRNGQRLLHSKKDTFGQKNVNVIFNASDSKELLEVDDKIILSYISKRFGFDLCPQLDSNVSVAFTEYTKLDAEENDTW